MHRRPYTKQTVRQRLWDALQKDDADSMIRTLQRGRTSRNANAHHFGYPECSRAEYLLLTEIILWNPHNKMMRHKGCGLLEACISNQKLNENGAPRCALAVVGMMKNFAVEGELNFVEKWSIWSRRRISNSTFPARLYACRRAWVQPLLDDLDLFAANSSHLPCRVVGVSESFDSHHSNPLSSDKRDDVTTEP